jgi:hypothetical protein
MDPVRVEVEQPRHPLREAGGVRDEAGIAIQHVLHRVEGRIAGQRLGVDHQPGLAAGSYDVPCVQTVHNRAWLGAPQGRVRKVSTAARASPASSPPSPRSTASSNESAHSAHICSSDENGCHAWNRSCPQAAQQPRDDLVLFVDGCRLPELPAGGAPLEQQRGRVLEPPRRE